MSKELAVDPVVLREEVKTKYREVDQSCWTIRPGHFLSRNRKQNQE
jgi:hypothetical protein